MSQATKICLKWEKGPAAARIVCTTSGKDPGAYIKSILKRVVWSQGNWVEGNSNMPGQRREMEIKSGYQIWQNVSLRLECRNNVLHDSSGSRCLFTDLKPFFWVRVVGAAMKLENFKGAGLGSCMEGFCLDPLADEQRVASAMIWVSSSALNRGSAESGVHRSPGWRLGRIGVPSWDAQTQHEWESGHRQG